MPRGVKLSSVPRAACTAVMHGEHMVAGINPPVGNAPARHREPAPHQVSDVVAMETLRASGPKSIIKISTTATLPATSISA